jgi:hypothetical protein
MTSPSFSHSKFFLSYPPKKNFEAELGLKGKNAGEIHGGCSGGTNTGARRSLVSPAKAQHPFVCESIVVSRPAKLFSDQVCVPFIGSSCFESHLVYLDIHSCLFGFDCNGGPRLDRLIARRTLSLFFSYPSSGSSYQLLEYHGQ